MDGYPYAYLAHSRPLILLVGLNSKILERDGQSLLSNGPRIASDIPPIDNSRSQALETAFLKFDPGDDYNETSDIGVPLSSMIFRFKSCGRQYTFPCRKASPAAAEVGSPVGSPGSAALRSPFSPLSHGSPLHPDGLMTPLWPMKYHDAIPSVLISVYSIGYDPQNDVLNDNRLKTEINALKNSLADSNYGITLAIVLVADKSMEQCLSTEERLANIRKGTKLENKSTFFYLASDIEGTDLKPFAQSILSGVRPISMDFYKNHYKKSRRKKDKSGELSPSTPTTEGISQNLSKSGWTIRSEYKMATFSEFRFEMDAAARHYKEVIDLMMESGGLFDLYHFWSPRWNEMRLLADTTALRRIRCLLANGQTSSAARFWRVYHYRTKQLLERKGKGTSTYAWKAWEARFAKCMAEIIQSMFYMATDSSARKALEAIGRKQSSAYAMPERSFQLDSFAPSDYLHHPGFWLNLSAKYTEGRRRLAKTISAEDLIPPGQSPAAKVARRSEVYDTFLCPDPHVEGSSYDHTAEIAELLEKTHREFRERGQSWMADRLRFSIASITEHATETETHAIQKAWIHNRWRDPTWAAVTKEINTKLHVLARKSGDFKTRIQTAWELLNSHLGQQENITYDIEKLLNEASESKLGGNSTPYEIKIVHEEMLSFLNVSFSFEKDSENLGEPLRAQVSIHSNAHETSAPLTLSYLLLTFNDNAPDVRITHSDSISRQDSGNPLNEITFKDSNKDAAQLNGEACLTINPQNTKVFTLHLSMREPGKVSATKAYVGIERELAKLEYSKNVDVRHERVHWYLLRNGILSSKRLFTRNSYQEINILPKLPKIKIHLPALTDKYYVGERIALELELVNDETYEVIGSVDIQLIEKSPESGAFVKIVEASDSAAEVADMSEAGTTYSCEFGALAPAAVEKKVIIIQMPNNPSDDLKIEFEARYRQTGGDFDSVSKLMSAKVLVAEPFRTTFGVSPDWHPDPWPSFFDAVEESHGDGNEGEFEHSPKTQALSSRWNFSANIVSLADCDLTIEKIKMDLHAISEATTASVEPVSHETVNLSPTKDHAVDFHINVSKQEMEDTTPIAMSPALRVSWCRAGSETSKYFEKFIPAPRMNLASNEPRVIGTLGKLTDEGVQILLHLENPSGHFLSFEIGVEPSDEFAFSGPKLGDVHLVPYSRHTVSFVLVPLVRGSWIQPVFKVVDVYFNKSLRINAGSGVKREPGTGALLVWVGS